MVNTTMAAVLNEIMSIQADEVCAPVLAIEKAENRVGDFAPDEEVQSNAKVIMRVALDEYAKAA